jgi:His/Glu/Gln/Arg/opine family amino acid ABC transporter permease subunit
MFSLETFILSLPMLARGTLETLILFVCALIGGGLVAFPVALARNARARSARWFGYGFIFVFRGAPLLVLLYLIYYGLPQFDILRHSPLWFLLREPYVCAVLALSRERTLALAAEKLGVDLSTVFRRLNALESRLQVRLFDRSTRGYQLTPAGELAASAAERKVTALASPAAPEVRIDTTRQYKVQQNDSLYKIASKLYGKGTMADKLYERNKAAIGPDPKRLKLGMILDLPEAPLAGPASANTPALASPAQPELESTLKNEVK